ncbi:MAG TPA: hypothetical protein VGB51_11085 [Actinomycetota bacterium]
MKVHDPALILYASFDRHLPGHVPYDPRSLAVELFGGAHTAYGLSQSDRWHADQAKDLDLDEVDQAEEGMARWVRRSAGEEATGLRQAMLYTFGDALVLHVADSLGEAERDFDEAWKELSEGPKTILRNEHWEEALGGFWGLNCIFSVLVDDEDYRTVAAERSLLESVSPGRPLLAETTVGRLWLAGSDWMEVPIPRPLRSSWVLISPRSATDHLYRSIQVGGPTPPPLPLLLASRQKFHVQIARYEEARRALRRARASLDKRVDWMIKAQRDFEEPSRIAGSPESEELRQKSARAHTNLAAFETEVVRIRDAQTTLEINVRNYEDLWNDFATGGEDEVFERERTYMRHRAEQVGYDTSYHTGVLERTRAILDAGQARFNISQDRGQAQEVRQGVTQVSGLFASLMALVVTEVVGLASLARDRPAFAAKIILLVLAGAFALSQVVVAWGRVRSALTGYSIAVAAGLGALLLLDADAGRWWHYPIALVVAGAMFSLVRVREERPRRDTEPGWRRIREFRSEIRKLRRASEEIADLLDDLPTTRYYRLKEERSFLEKIESKGRDRPGYSEVDVGDSIGIRYVTSPFQLPVVVEHVERILDRRQEGLEYKTGRYKAVHIDVDLLGVGAKKDLNLMAEVQVKTYLQHLYAASAHDVLYKDIPGRGPWVLRLAKRWTPTRVVADRLLALPAAVELLLFRRWMRWPKRGEESVRPPRWRRRQAEHS